MEFDIKPYVVKDCSSNFDNMIQQVRSVKDGVGRVRRNISINSASTANIRTSLRNSQNNMEALIEKLASLENGLDVAVDLYLSCERNILGQQNNNTNSSSGRKGLSGWWSNFKEWASTGVWDDPDKAARIKRDKAMAKELRDLLKSERFSKKTWKKASVEERKQILTELFAEMQRIYGIELTDITIQPIEAEPGYITYDIIWITINLCVLMRICLRMQEIINRLWTPWPMKCGMGINMQWLKIRMRFRSIRAQ